METDWQQEIIEGLPENSGSSPLFTPLCPSTTFLRTVSKHNFWKVPIFSTFPQRHRREARISSSQAAVPEHTTEAIVQTRCDTVPSGMGRKTQIGTQILILVESALNSNKNSYPVCRWRQTRSLSKTPKATGETEHGRPLLETRAEVWCHLVNFPRHNQGFRHR